MDQYGADTLTIALAAFEHEMEPQIYHVGVEEEDKEVSTEAYLKRWMDHAFMRNERDWTLRQVKVFEGTSGFMLAYMP